MSNGKIIDTLINQKLNRGSHSIVWNPKNITSGVYLVSLETKMTKATNKVIYIK